MNPLHLRFGTAALAAAGFTALGTPALAASLTVGVEIPPPASGRIPPPLRGRVD